MKAADGRQLACFVHVDRGEFVGITLPQGQTWNEKTHRRFGRCFFSKLVICRFRRSLTRGRYVVMIPTESDPTLIWNKDICQKEKLKIFPCW